MSRPLAFLGLLLTFFASNATANQPVTLGTNWMPETEHGGFYQAVADGSYADCGLDVTIVPGEPQQNNRAAMLAGKIDFALTANLLGTFSAASEGVPTVAVMAVFQKNPRVFLTHPGRTKSFEDMKKLRIYVSDEGYATYYHWMENRFGFPHDRREVYTSDLTPFLEDPDSAVQAFVSSEPYLIAQSAGFTPDVYLLADVGWSTYAALIETMTSTVETRPEVVQCFVDGTARGWYGFLYGDNAKAVELLKAANPELSDEKIHFGIAALRDAGIVDSGDTLKQGIGTMTEARIHEFYDQMVAVGLVPSALDYSAAFTLQFVGKGTGVELRK